MPMPWSTPEISTVASAALVVTSTVESHSEYETAFATRFATAAVTCSWLPNTSSPPTPPVTMEIRLESAWMAEVSTATAMTSSTETGTGVSSGSSPCSRDSSMTCWTSRDSRSLSVSIRPANRFTASGSSAASCTASASSLIAPTGVFSSWLTLATKSRRTASTRRSRVRSSTSASTSREPSGATRAVTWRAGMPMRDIRISVSRICPSLRTWRTRSASSSEDRAVPRTRPRAYAGAEALSTTSLSSTTTALERSTESTVATPGGTTGSSTGVAWRCCRSLTCHASTAPPATMAPISAARNACVVGSTGTRVRRHSPAVDAPTTGFETFTPRSCCGPGLSPGAPRLPRMREAFHEQLDSVFDDLSGIAGRVEDAVRQATSALLTGDAEIAERVISGDVEIDRARERVEDKAFSLLSLQQPVAGDLRTIVAALRMVSELERMGDLSVHVAKIARLRVPNIAVPEEVRPTMSRMAEVAEDMVAQLLQIITARDVEAAIKLGRDDEEMDQLRRTSFTELLSDDWSHGVEAAVDIALLGRYYERIADHAVSVANRVVFVVTGENPRAIDA